MTRANGRKTIFITGAASGMGRETALLFGQRGWFVGAYDLQADKLRTLAHDLGPEHCMTGVLDVGNKAAYDHAMAVFSQACDGRLDLLFNNAGITGSGLFGDTTHEELMRVINVNLVGVINGIEAALPLLKRTPQSLVFSVASSAAMYGLPLIAVYSATKHAVKGLTEALSLEFRRFGIRVADVLPGVIDTALLTDAIRQAAPKTGPWRVVPAIEIAKAVWSAYHDKPERLHWYVPEDIADYDRQAGLDPEGTRERILRESPTGPVLQAILAAAR